MLTNYCPKSNLWLQMAKQCWPTTVPSQIRVCRWLNTIDQLLSQVKFVSADGLTLLTNYCPKSNWCLQMPRQYWPTTDPSQIRVCWWLNNIDQLLSQVKFVSADGLTLLTNYCPKSNLWLLIALQWWHTLVSWGNGDHKCLSILVIPCSRTYQHHTEHIYLSWDVVMPSRCVAAPLS